jgi:hypothetical protein
MNPLKAGKGLCGMESSERVEFVIINENEIQRNKGEVR